MRFADLLYRTRQFWLTVRASALSDEDQAVVDDLLTPAQQELFARMQLSEQHHGLRVLNMLREQGETDPDLMVAALLHDVGKSRYRLRLWERVLIVLGRAFFPDRVRRWGQASLSWWNRPFVVAEQHPEWGASLALEAGCSSLAVDLIRYHQAESPPQSASPREWRLLHLLQQADGQQ
jgi:hypothetical protein